MYLSSTSSHRYQIVQDKDQAKLLAQNLWKRISQNGQKQQLGNIDFVPILQQIYRPIDSRYEPSNLDINGYKSILDRNSDGLVTYQDIEDLITRYFCYDSKQPRYFEDHQPVSRLNRSSEIQDEGLKHSRKVVTQSITYSQQQPQQYVATQPLTHQNQTVTRTVYHQTGSGIQRAPSVSSSSQNRSPYQSGVYQQQQ